MSKEAAYLEQRAFVVRHLREASGHLLDAARGLEDTPEALSEADRALRRSMSRLEHGAQNGYRAQAPVRRKLEALARRFERTAAEIRAVPVTRAEKARAEAERLNGHRARSGR